MPSRVALCHQTIDLSRSFCVSQVHASIDCIRLRSGSSRGGTCRGRHRRLQHHMPCTHRVMLPNEISNRTRNSCRAVIIGSQAARLGPLVTPTGLVTANGPWPSRKEPLRLPPLSCATFGPKPADGQAERMGPLATFALLAVKGHLISRRNQTARGRRRSGLVRRRVLPARAA